VALESPTWHRYIARLSLAESGLGVVRATPLLFDKFIYREGIRGRRAIGCYPVVSALTVGSWVWLLLVCGGVE
jgi:hypothetical protein